MEANRRLMEYLEKEPVSFHVWLRQIARDQLLMARRHHVDAAQRAVTREVQLPERSALQLAEKLITDGSTPSQHLAKKEQAQRIREGLNKLSDMDREILLMRNLEQLTYKDISYLLEIEPAAAKMRHGRALIRLGKILHTNGLTESQI